MPRRELTLEEQLKGVRGALRSKRTPQQLREGLSRRKRALERLLEKAGRKNATQKHPMSRRRFTL